MSQSQWRNHCVQTISAAARVTQWRSFLRSSNNTTKFIEFLVNYWKQEQSRIKVDERGKVLYVTCEEKRFKISADVDEISELFATHEEADTRMILHAKHIAQYNYEAIVLSSMETDVRVLCLAFADRIQVPIFQKCGTSSRVIYLDISKIAKSLGSNVCRALPSVHAFIGCDSVSAFAGKGKVSSLKLLKGNTTFQETFANLGASWALSEKMFRKLESFTCKTVPPAKAMKKISMFFATKCFAPRREKLNLICYHHVKTVSECMQNSACYQAAI